MNYTSIIELIEEFQAEDTFDYSSDDENVELINLIDNIPKDIEFSFSPVSQLSTSTPSFGTLRKSARRSWFSFLFFIFFFASIPIPFLPFFFNFSVPLSFIHPRYSKMLVLGKQGECFPFVIAIIASLSVQNHPFPSPLSFSLSLLPLFSRSFPSSSSSSPPSRSSPSFSSSSSFVYLLCCKMG